jgi:hypothetical protein
MLTFTSLTLSSDWKISTRYLVVVPVITSGDEYEIATSLELHCFRIDLSTTTRPREMSQTVIPIGGF